MADFLDYFSTQSQLYADCRPLYPPDLAKRLIQRVPACMSVWDAGCGSGQFSVSLAEHAQVTATDASPSQVARARPAERVNYRVAPCEASGLPDHAVDLCTAAQAAHWFDLDAYYREVRRVTRPGGGVALVTYGLMTIDSVVDEVLMNRLYATELREYWPAERRLVEDGYASIDFPFKQERFDAPPMSHSWTRDQVWGYVCSWSAIAAMPPERRHDSLREIHASLVKAWPDNEERRVEWPLRVRFGRVEKSGG